MAFCESVNTRIQEHFELPLQAHRAGASVNGCSALFMPITLLPRQARGAVRDLSMVGIFPIEIRQSIVCEMLHQEPFLAVRLLCAHSQNSLGGQRNPKWGLTMRIWEASSILVPMGNAKPFLGLVALGVSDSQYEAR